MKFYRNAIILVAVAALLVGAFFLMGKLKDKNDDDAPSGTDFEALRLTDYTSDKVESLMIQRAEVTFVIVKNDDIWVLDSPEGIDAEPSVLSSIVINAASIIADKLVEEETQDFGKYGLDKPVLITLKLKDGDVKHLEIGNMTPTKSGYYVRMSGEDKVFVLGTYTGNKLMTDKNGIRKKGMFDIEPDEINALSMDRHGQNLFSAVKESDTDWTLTDPIKGTAKYSELYRMLEAICGATVVEFIDEKTVEPAAYGLDSPSYAFKVETEKQGAFKLLLGAEKVKGKEIYAKLDGEDEIVAIDISLFDFLDKPLKEIIEVFAYIVNIDQVKKIDLTMDGKTTHIILDVYKDEDGESDMDLDKFYINGKDASGKDESDKQPFRTFYQGLIGICLDEIEPDAVPTGTAEITIEYTLVSGSMKVEFIPKDANYYYVMRNGEYAGILVKKSKKDLGIQGMRESYDMLMDFISG